MLLRSVIRLFLLRISPHHHPRPIIRLGKWVVETIRQTVNVAAAVSFLGLGQHTIFQYVGPLARLLIYWTCHRGHSSTAVPLLVMVVLTSLSWIRLV